MDLDSFVRGASALVGQDVVQRASQLFLAWKKHDWTLLYIFLAFAAGLVIGRYRAERAHRAVAFQNRGEALLSRALKNFGPPDYHLMNHLTLRMRDGTTQVDHILVSRFGVFVIETKDYKGWIFANPTQEKWTQVLFRAKFRFQNPILQNNRHVRAVRDLLDFLPPDAIKSVVVFTGAAKFKTEIPDGVFSVSGLIRYLHDQTVEAISPNRMHLCVGRLETARLAITRQTDVEHMASLQRRHNRAGLRSLPGSWRVDTPAGDEKPGSRIEPI